MIPQKNAAVHCEKELVEPFEENKDVCLMRINKRKLFTKQLL